ncbi:FAD dependent oxidoreductase [Thozetella sp. PMI_491]|nr:FAD dependent oxidoreductase [Thozetella sp. PMI_491]
MSSTSASILILGAGCFGLSTAHHLASAGYKNITVLERDDAIPSRYSAGYDINKVVRAEYADTFYTDLSLKAIAKWQKDPLYSPHYHQTGFLNVTSKHAPEQTKQVVQRYIRSIDNHVSFKGKVTPVSGENDIHKLVPAFSGPVENWSGYFNRLAGYVHSSNAMQSVYEDCVRLGVKFYCGRDNGEVKALIYASEPRMVDRMRCIGAQTIDGQIYLADKIVVAAGASVTNLLPSMGSMVAAKCWGVVHIQLTPEEAEQLRNIPVTQVRDLAFFFEPDPATHKLKFCHMGGAYTNYTATNDGYSIPYPTLEGSQFVPADDEIFIRKLLRDVLPQFADRPLIDAHLCWVADSDDSDFIIDYVPGTDSSLVVLSADSGHGFKMLPIFGEFVTKLLKEGSQAEPKWRWKRGPLAQSHNWRAGASQDLGSLDRAKL